MARCSCKLSVKYAANKEVCTTDISAMVLQGLKMVSWIADFLTQAIKLVDKHVKSNKEVVSSDYIVRCKDRLYSTQKIQDYKPITQLHRCDFPDCLRMFGGSEPLQKHIGKKHTDNPIANVPFILVTGAKKFQCVEEGCSKANFEKKLQLKKHYVSHTDEVFEYGTEDCDKRFNRKDGLQEHLKGGLYGAPKSFAFAKFKVLVTGCIISTKNTAIIQSLGVSVPSNLA